MDACVALSSLSDQSVALPSLEEASRQRGTHSLRGSLVLRDTGVELDCHIPEHDMTVFEVTQIGDIPLKLIIKKDNGGYVSEIETHS